VDKVPAPRPFRGRWPEELGELAARLSGLYASMERATQIHHFPWHQLDDPKFWLTWSSLGVGDICWHLRDYVTWWISRNPRQRHRDVKRGFANWLRIAQRKGLDRPEPVVQTPAPMPERTHPETPYGPRTSHLEEPKFEPPAPPSPEDFKRNIEWVRKIRQEHFGR
jgi:hypothetical protein